MTEYIASVEGAFSTSNDPDPSKRHSWHLRVQDDVSGEVLAAVQVTSEDFMTLMRGGRIKTVARVSPNLHRLGKEMRNWSVQVPKEVQSYGDPTPETVEWVQANSPEPFDTVEIRRTNGGLVAVYRKWGSGDD